MFSVISDNESTLFLNLDHHHIHDDSSIDESLLPLEEPFLIIQRLHGNIDRLGTRGFKYEDLRSTIEYLQE